MRSYMATKFRGELQICHGHRNLCKAIITQKSSQYTKNIYERVTT